MTKRNGNAHRHTEKGNKMTKKTGKSFKNISELIDDILHDDKKGAAAAKKAVEAYSVARELMCMRIRHKLTQKQLAEKAGTSQGTISKIEDKCNDDMRLSDLRLYAEACGEGFGLFIKNEKEKARNRAQEAKSAIHYAECCIRELEKISKGDESMLEGILGLIHELDEKLSTGLKKELEKKPRKSTASEPMKIETTPEHCEFACP